MCYFQLEKWFEKALQVSGTEKGKHNPKTPELDVTIRQCLAESPIFVSTWKMVNKINSLVPTCINVLLTI